MTSKIFSFIFLILTAAAACALDIGGFWRHPEIADKNSLFADAGISFPILSPDSFSPLPVRVRIDYLPPLPLAFSFGIFVDTPNPNIKSFGIRAAYHINVFAPKTDVYLLYSFNFGFLLKKTLYDYNDEPPPLRFFDFGFGVRYFFFSFIGLSLETDFKLERLFISLSFKLL